MKLQKKIDGYRYSKSLRKFYYPNTKEILQKLAEHFNELADVIMERDLAIPEATKTTESIWELNNEGKEKLKEFKYWMQSKRYSASTIYTYKEAFKAFFKFHRERPVSEITNQDVIVFNNEFVLKYKLSFSYQIQFVNALKLFFKTVENKAIDIDLICRPRRQQTST